MQLCAAAAAAAEVETAAAVVVPGDSGADAVAADAAGERTALVAVETETGSTQQDVACGRAGPGRRTQGATALAAPSHPGDGLQDGWAAQRAGPPAERRDPEEEEELAAGGLAWQQRNQGADSGAALCDQYRKSVPSSRGMDFQSLASNGGEQNVQQDLLTAQTGGKSHQGP